MSVGIAHIVSSPHSPDKLGQEEHKEQPHFGGRSLKMQKLIGYPRSLNYIQVQRKAKEKYKTCWDDSSGIQEVSIGLPTVEHLNPKFKPEGQKMNRVLEMQNPITKPISQSTKSYSSNPTNPESSFDQDLSHVYVAVSQTKTSLPQCAESDHTDNCETQEREGKVTKDDNQPIITIPMAALSVGHTTCTLQIAHFSWGSLVCKATVILLPDVQYAKLLDILLSSLSNGTVLQGTRNIDCLASEGVMLMQHLAAVSMCTPSQAAFLTGRYPIRSGMVSPCNLNRALTWLGGSGGLPTNETTFAELLQHRGYCMGLIGKWHLGLSCASRNDHCYHPLNHGFHYFYGMPFGLLSDCQASGKPELHRWLRIKLWISTALTGLVPLLLLILKLARWFSVPWKVIFFSALLAFLFFTSWYSSYGFVRRWNCILMRNHEIIQQPMKEEKVASLLLKEALAFIERYKREPFLLFFSFLHVHTPLISKEKFVGHSKYGRYGDNVEEMDWMVGKYSVTPL
uniref:arylsulfatase H n=1 Tax=Callithrix jacchus TaxID=9483 RepID=UPI0023DD368A|nr:arylsulfatase H [Callithrix jacchus]